MLTKKQLLITAIILVLISSIAMARVYFLNAKANFAKLNCYANLDEIAGYKAIWAIKNKLATNDIVTMENVKDAKNGLVMHYPYVCRAGGSYTVGRVDENPTCSFHQNLLPAGSQLQFLKGFQGMESRKADSDSAPK